MASYKELLVQREALDAAIAQARKAETGAVIAQIHGLMAQYGLSTDDLTPRRGRPRGSKSASVAKYRNPKTGQTWSGRGRAPAWIGKQRERFLITQA